MGTALTRMGSVVSVATGTMASRVLGAVRDAVIAALFTAVETDAFFVAFTIPNTLRALFAEGAASAAVVPTYTRIREHEGQAAARLFASRILGVMFSLLMVVSLLGMVFSPGLVNLYAGGTNPQVLDMTVVLTRWMFPYLVLIGVSALLGAIAQSEGRFWATAWIPVLLNVAVVGCAWLGLSTFTLALGLPQVGVLAIGVLLGGLLQMVAQWFALLRSTGFQIIGPVPFGLNVAFRDPQVMSSLKLMAPLALGLGVYQLNMMLTRLLASFLDTGAQSYLYYGQRVVEIPQGVFALAVATASLPVLSRLHAQRDGMGMRDMLIHSLGLSSFFAVPAALFIAVFAEPIVSVLFLRGHFDVEAMQFTAASLRWFAIAVIWVSMVRALVPFFHAQGQTRKPVVASAVNLAVFVGLSLLLMESYGHVGLAMASAAASALQCVVLLVQLGNMVTYNMVLEVVRRLSIQLLAATMACGAAWFVMPLGHWSTGGLFVHNAGVLGVGAAVYVILFFGCMVLSGSHEAKAMYGALRSLGRRQTAQL